MLSNSRPLATLPEFRAIEPRARVRNLKYCATSVVFYNDSKSAFFSSLFASATARGTLAGGSSPRFFLFSGSAGASRVRATRAAGARPSPPLLPAQFLAQALSAARLSQRVEQVLRRVLARAALGTPRRTSKHRGTSCRFRACSNGPQDDARYCCRYCLNCFPRRLCSACSTNGRRDKRGTVHGHGAYVLN